MWAVRGSKKVGNSPKIWQLEQQFCLSYIRNVKLIPHCGPHTEHVDVKWAEPVKLSSVSIKMQFQKHISLSTS